MKKKHNLFFRAFFYFINIKSIGIILTALFLIANQATISATSYQQHKVTGTVIDSENGTSMVGVSIVVKGTTVGTLSDADGKFTIDLPNTDAVLVFSYVGYTTKEVTPGESQILNITLEQSQTIMNEIVVVGYGVQKKSLSTGAIGTIDEGDFKGTTFQRADQAFEGKIAGLQAVPVSGSPGASMNLRIRGYGTNGNANPLYVVDGIITSDISNIDPSDIQSEEVLKDAASCAIYGAQGGNGVIMITTKKGEKGKSEISYDFSYAWQSAAHLPTELDGPTYTAYMSEKNGAGFSQFDNSGLGNLDVQSANTNWTRSIFATGYLEKHNLSFSGSNDKTTFYASLNYLTNNGIVAGNQDLYSRYSIRVNADSKMNKFVKVSTNLSYTYSSLAGINENGGEFGGVISSALQMDPSVPVEYTGALPTWLQTDLANNDKSNYPLVTSCDGKPFGISAYTAGEIRNPFVTNALTNGSTIINHLLGGFTLDITPFKGFVFTSRLGADYSYSSQHYWNSIFYYDATNANGVTGVVENDYSSLQWSWDNFINYNVKIKDHELNAMVGMSAMDKKVNNINATASNMDLPYAPFSEFDYTMSGYNVKGNLNENKLLSYFGRLQYDYQSKYLLEANLRCDGAGALQIPPANAWGYFPSFSGGWVFSSESFFPKDIFSYGKLKASWGENGSLVNVSTNFGWEPGIGSTSGGNPITYPGPNGVTVAAEQNSLGNTNLTWETDIQTDLGIELRAMKDRLTFTFDYWDKTTKNLLFNGVTLTPEASVWNTPTINGGTVENIGLEIGIGFRDKIGDFHYDVAVNLSPLIKNNVTSLNSNLGKYQNGAVIGT